LSSPSELLAALSAFDDDDSGQVDAGELIDALLHTAPEIGHKTLNKTEISQVMEGFVGKRAFSKSSTGNSTRGDVFRYKDWVQGMGAVAGGEGEKVQTAAA